MAYQTRRKRRGTEGATGTTRTKPWHSAEFLLVSLMLIVLLILVIFVSYSPYPEGPGTNTTATLVLDYRKNILAILVTTFGAWIGAGAAFYFGRENLKDATASLLQAQGLSSKERLGAAAIRDLPPRRIEWTVPKTATVGTVLDYLRKNPEDWFIPVVDGKGRLETVLNEEAFYRFIDERTRTAKGMTAEAARAQIDQETIDAVVTYIQGAKLGKFQGIHVPVSLDDSIGTANELMDRRFLKLAIVLDSDGRPTHYLTTGDVREFLLKG